MRWSFFFMGEYASMFAVCGVASILFLGGWHTGTGLDTQLQAMRSAGAAAGADGTQVAMGYLANVIGLGVFVAKASFLVFVQVWVRWTLPRLRIDQVMVTCLKYLLPISCALFLGAVIWPLLFVATEKGMKGALREPLGDRAAAVLADGTAPVYGAEKDSVPVPEHSRERGESHEPGESHEKPASEEDGSVTESSDSPVSVGLVSAEVR